MLLESEKGSMYFAFDTTELLKGDILKRYQAYQIALQSNFMQIDEVRYKEDLPKLGFNYVKLGLQDVLLDVKSGTVYTPNTNQTAKIGAKVLQNGVKGDIIDDTVEEKRFNPYHDPTNGRFTSGASGIGATSSSSDNSSFNRPTLSLPKQEYGKVVHYINEVYETCYKGKTEGYITLANDNGYFSYSFEIKEFGEYNIYEKEEF